MPSSCYICGAPDRPLTSDHVIPKVLFPQPRPNNLITEGACEPCNNGISKDDALFAVFLSAALGRNESGKWVWENKSVKSILARSPALATQLISDSYKKQILTEMGIAEVDLLRISEDRLNRVLFRIVKGLLRKFAPHFSYWECEFTSTRLWPTKETAELIAELATKMTYLERGTGVFRCLYGFPQDGPGHVSFIFIFFDSVGFVIEGHPMPKK
jgi:hypothetical protein